MLVFASVIALRVREPSLPRVVRMGGNVRFGSSDIPVLALLGLAMSWALWVLDLGTHRAGRILPPAWLACGVLLFVVMRRVQGKPLLERFDAVAPPPPEVIDLRFGTIVVPLKQCGPIEEEMLAIACKLAQEQEGERVLGVNVVEVPLSLPLDAPIAGADECAMELLQLTAMFSRDYGVPVEFMPAAQPRHQRRGRAHRPRAGRRPDPGRRRAAHRRARRPRAGLLGDDREPAAPRPLPRDRDVVPARHRERRDGRGRGCRRAHPARARAGRLESAHERIDLQTATWRRGARSSRGPSTTATSSVAMPMPT